MHLIFSETGVIGQHYCLRKYGSIFIQFCAVGSKRRIFSAAECAFAVQGHPFGTNRKRVSDFLFVPHCDYGPILHDF